MQHMECDEVPISLHFEPMGTTELASMICGDNLYFSVTELFGFLRIHTTTIDKFNSQQGFIRNQDDIFTLDVDKRTIYYNSQEIRLEDSDFVINGDGMYVRDTIFNQVFGLRTTFDFRSLSAILVPEIELPVLKEAKRAKIWGSLGSRDFNMRVDTLVTRKRSLFDFGTAIWDVFTTQRSDGVTYNRIGTGFGGMLLGGEFRGRFNYEVDQPIEPRNQLYSWRLVNNENKYIRQLTLGKIGVPSKVSLFSPVTGLHITNAPSFRKKTFGVHTISDYTKPGWMVELYINEVLVDVTKADLTGLYRFEVPLVYGSTTVGLRFYGPFGEEESSIQQITVPFSLQQKGRLEYSLNAGFVDGTGDIY
ncbi:MAG: hypothetical protein AB3N16_05910, partial [Flavobacteriaceae bacterium]